MSNQNEELETEIRAIRAINEVARSSGRQLSHRERIKLDRRYRSVLTLLGPRFRFFIRKYGLLDMQDDAMQACAIAAYRAAEEFDGDKASFATFVTWKIRGELQGLRHRMRLDQRGSARRVSAQTVSMDAMIEAGGGEAVMLVDEQALAQTESGASGRMTRNLTKILLDDYAAMCREKAGRRPRHIVAVRPGTVAPDGLDAFEAKLVRERQIVTSHLLDIPYDSGDHSMTSEQRRQVTRRVLRHVGARVQAEPRFAAALSTVH